MLGVLDGAQRLRGQLHIGDFPKFAVDRCRSRRRDPGRDGLATVGPGNDAHDGHWEEDPDDSTGDGADDEAAIALANDTAYGLNASVWTLDVARGRRIAARIRTGTVNINEAYAAAWASVAAPMGGMKASGIGRRHGAEGLLRFTESQNVTAQRVLPVAPACGLGDETFTKVLTGALRVMKALRLQ